jgi:hypothetical protein
MSRIVLLGLLLGAASLATSCRRVVIVHEVDGPGEEAETAQSAPPAAKVEVVPAAPSVSHVWIPGYWSWRTGAWVWIAGCHVVRPRPAAVWVPGHYARHAHGWVWTRGHWR